MLLHKVSLQCGRLWEWVITLGALESFLVGVRVHVTTKITCRREVFVAVLTLEGCACEMCVQVFFQVACLSKRLTTTVAQIRKDLKKNVYLILQHKKALPTQAKDPRSVTSNLTNNFPRKVKSNHQLKFRGKFRIYSKHADMLSNSTWIADIKKNQFGEFFVIPSILGPETGQNKQELMWTPEIWTVTSCLTHLASTSELTSWLVKIVPLHLAWHVQLVWLGWIF